jgi:hypothetical protein
MSEKTAWLYDRFAVLLAAAMDHNGETVADVLVEVNEREGSDGIFAICCALADSIRRLAFPGIEIGDGTLTGDLAVVEKTSAEAGSEPALWVARFVAAYINGDKTRYADLFFLSLESDQELHLAAVVELLKMTADVARIREAELS